VKPLGYPITFRMTAASADYWHRMADTEGNWMRVPSHRDPLEQGAPHADLLDEGAPHAGTHWSRAPLIQ
jgi:hypothetical protein